MRRTTTWVLAGALIASAALAAAMQIASLHAPVPPAALATVAIVCALLLVIRALPPKPRRPVVFVVTLAVLVALVGGLAYFQFALKPDIVKAAISAAFAPKPTTVAVEEAKVEQWPPLLFAIGTLRAYQGVVVAPQVAGVVTTIHFESGDDVAAGAPLVDLDTSVEQADLANGLAQLKNANVTLDRARALIANGNTPQSTVDAAQATRDSAAASVERTRAVIAEKKITAPFAGRLGLRNVDLGQYVAAGANLTTLQRLDPIYVDFPATENALATLAVGQPTTISVELAARPDFRRPRGGDRRARQRRIAQRDRARRIAQPRSQAAARHVRRRLRRHRRGGRRVDPAAHRDRLQPLRRQRLRGRPGAPKATA